MSAKGVRIIEDDLVIEKSVTKKLMLDIYKYGGSKEKPRDIAVGYFPHPLSIQSRFLLLETGAIKWIKYRLRRAGIEKKICSDWLWNCLKICQKLAEEKLAWYENEVNKMFFAENDPDINKFVMLRLREVYDNPEIFSLEEAAAKVRAEVGDLPTSNIYLKRIAESYLKECVAVCWQLVLSDNVGIIEIAKIWLDIPLV